MTSCLFNKGIKKNVVKVVFYYQSFDYTDLAGAEKKDILKGDWNPHISYYCLEDKVLVDEIKEVINSSLDYRTKWRHWSRVRPYMVIEFYDEHDELLETAVLDNKHGFALNEKTYLVDRKLYKWLESNIPQVEAFKSYKGEKCVHLMSGAYSTFSASSEKNNTLQELSHSD